MCSILLYYNILIYYKKPYTLQTVMRPNTRSTELVYRYTSILKRNDFQTRRSTLSLESPRAPRVCVFFHGSRKPLKKPKK